ncbi:type VII secretion integral membrane protein EccD [Mycobacterium parmense]|nr:type VII secretion integral membrane protein EccD [Mycobacterium parmense]ORW48508.1 hypothetical protein AWC20_26705 [Mycobacterium parmense]
MSVHAGAAVVDLVLPAETPVGVLLPSIVDLLPDQRGDDGWVGTRHQLSLPGAAPLDTSTTLVQNDIPDGAVLVLSRPATPLPAPRFHDAAEALAQAPGPGSRVLSRRAIRLTAAVAAACVTVAGLATLIWTSRIDAGAREVVSVATASAALVALLLAVIAQRSYRDGAVGLTLGLATVAFATATGFLAVPGGPGAPHVLLGATATAVTSVVTMRAAACGLATFTATSALALIVALAASAALLTAAPLRAVGAASALVSVGLLGVAARLSILLAGLSPRPSDPGDPALADRAARAECWLSGLLTAFASSAAGGAVVTVLAGAPGLSCTAFGALTGALLLLRARSAGRSGEALTFTAGGTAVVVATLTVAASRAPAPAAWVVAVTAGLAAAALYLGFVAPERRPSPVARRGVELLECAALVVLVPLTCWVCGLYGAVRALDIPRLADLR